MLNGLRRCWGMWRLWAALEDAGVLCAFTVKNAQISPGDNPYALNRVRVSGDYSLDSFKALL